MFPKKELREKYYAIKREKKNNPQVQIEKLKKENRKLKKKIEELKKC